MKALFKLPLIKKLLVVGDSISYHNPSSSLGWLGSWGMAASAQGKDYVHRLLEKITDYQGSEPELLIMAEGGGTLAAQEKQTDRMTAFRPDLAIVQMGENDRDISSSGFQAPYESIILAIRSGNPQALVLCVGTWGPPIGCPEKDNLIRNACRNCHALFVDISQLNREPNGSALSENRYTHDGVNWHPGDAGMKGYAETLWKALLNPECADPSQSAVSSYSQINLEEKWDGLSHFKWNSQPKVDPGLETACFFSNDGGNETGAAEATLPVELLRGNRFDIRSFAKSDPGSLSHIEFSLLLVDAEAKEEIHQAIVEDAPGKWVPISLHVRVPENMISARLRLRTSTPNMPIWVKSIFISAAPAPSR